MIAIIMIPISTFESTRMFRPNMREPMALSIYVDWYVFCECMNRDERINELFSTFLSILIYENDEV